MGNGGDVMPVGDSVSAGATKGVARPGSSGLNTVGSRHYRQERNDRRTRLYPSNYPAHQSAADVVAAKVQVAAQAVVDAKDRSIQTRKEQGRGHRRWRCARQGCCC